MNILKMKRFFYLFITLAVVGVLVTSCDKDIIEVEPNSLKTVTFEEDQLLQNESLNDGISLRGCSFSVFQNNANAALNNLAQIIEECAANPTRFNKNRVIKQYDYYRLNVLEPCLPQQVVVPVLIFDNNPNTNCNFVPGSCSDGSAPLNTLTWFLCHLGNFIENPNDSSNQTDLENAFDYYISTLNNCFGTNFTASVDL